MSNPHCILPPGLLVQCKSEMIHLELLRSAILNLSVLYMFNLIGNISLSKCLYCIFSYKDPFIPYVDLYMYFIVYIWGLCSIRHSRHLPWGKKVFITIVFSVTFLSDILWHFLSERSQKSDMVAAWYILRGKDFLVLDGVP